MNPDGGTADPTRRWLSRLHCETCDWSRTIRSTSADAAFALATDDAQRHATLNRNRIDYHSVTVVDGETGRTAVYGRPPDRHPDAG